MTKADTKKPLGPDQGRNAVFLEKSTYRRRRLRDTARLLPVVGGILFLLPLLWPTKSDATLTSSALIYLFLAWAVLIVLAAVLSRPLQRREDGTIEKPK
jgi:hypothetical protein